MKSSAIMITYTKTINYEELCNDITLFELSSLTKYVSNYITAMHSKSSCPQQTCPNIEVSEKFVKPLGVKTKPTKQQ